MTEGLWVALIAAVPATVAAVAALKARSHSKETRYQTQNSHTTNLRDDLDKVLKAVVGIPALSKKVGMISGTQRAMRKDMATMRTILDRHSEQIWEMEKTVPPRSTNERK